MDILDSTGITESIESEDHQVASWYMSFVSKQSLKEPGSPSLS